MGAIGTINIIAFVVFAVALCWRLDQIRRNGGGLQPLAMTTAIAALVLAFVVNGADMRELIDTTVFTGAARVVFYAMLALGVASLIIVFFFPAPGQTRERRAGMEAIPLVVALLGLQVTMLVTPIDVRTEPINAWTVRNVGFGLFLLIASGYLAYGLLACVRNVRRFLRLADGYLRTSLGLLMGGLVLLAFASMLQIVFVVISMTGTLRISWLFTTGQVLAGVGVVAFLVGISYPMLHSRWQTAMVSRRRRRADEELVPLWTLLTEAVPEVVLPRGARITPTESFHRRVVETRDALTQISPYLSDDFADADDEVRAAMVCDAVAAYVDEGPISAQVRDVLPGEGTGIDADAAPLLRVARELPEA